MKPKEPSDYVANQNREFLPFKEARAFARNLNLKSKEQWQAFTKTDKRPAESLGIPQVERENSPLQPLQPLQPRQ